MTRTNYITVEDVLRQFDPTLSRADLGTAFTEESQILAHMEGVEGMFEMETGNALREVRVGSSGNPETYEYQDGVRVQDMTKAYLSHRNVQPLDSSKGDVLEIRTGRDTWEDITDSTDRWGADYRKGVLEVWTRLLFITGVGRSHQEDERYIRTSYRYGALGGDSSSGGQTTLAESLSDSQTGTVSVDDATRLPRGTNIVKIDDEYVQISNVNSTNDTVDVDLRALRDTSASAHSSGDVVHYCPLDVRDAIARKVAVRLFEQENFTDYQTDSGANLDISEKIERYEQDWIEVTDRYGDNFGYK